MDELKTNLFLVYLHSAISGLLIGYGIGHLFGFQWGFPIAIAMGSWGVWSAVITSRIK